MASATPNARPRLPLRSTALFALGLGAWIGGPPAALATDPVPDPVLGINQLLAQAMPDECFDGVGVDYPPINPDGTCDQGQPKANQSYVWGLTEQGGKLWFGTLSNAACILDGLAGGQPTVTSLFDCEFG